MHSAHAICGVLLISLAGTGAAETVTRRALLIGINEYAAPRIPDLRGAVNDVTQARQVLITRLGFRPADITLITNTQATRSEILGRIDALIAASRGNDVVYLHYSGHGSQAADRNGDETDGHDETILPHDARQPGIPDIIDDELYERLARLKAAAALFVFDSCHSGTITRLATPVQPRFVPPDERAELYVDRTHDTRDIVAADRTPYVLMAGAPAGQEALDGPVDEGWFGLFSYALARAFDSLGPSATPAEIHARTRIELERIRQQLYTRPPEPTLEGPQQRLQQPLFSPSAVAQAGSPDIARRAWVPVRRADASRLRLVSGLALNAQVGSRWAVYPDGEVRFEFGMALAVGTVERTEGNDAILRVTYARKDVTDNSRAIPFAPAMGASAIPVRFEGPPSQRVSVERMLRERLNNVSLVDAGRFARFIIIHGNGEWRVMDAAGLHEVMTMRNASDDEVAAALARLLSSAQATITLLALENRGSNDLAEARIVGEDRHNGLTSPSPQFNRHVKRANEIRSARNSLMLEVRTHADAYITIASVDTEGGIAVLFPNMHQRAQFLPDGWIAAGATVRIPDSLIPDNRAGFHWDYSPPAGRETIRVFAARDRPTAELLREFIRRSALDSGALVSLQSELARRATGDAQDLHASRGASATGTALPHGEWSATSVVVEILP
jgi:hypothetical protein